MSTVSIETRKLKSGKFSFRARVRITQKNKILEEETKTFKNRESAEIWAKKITKKLEQRQKEKDLGIFANLENDYEETTVYDLIDRYLNHPKLSEQLGRTKYHVLKALKNYDIANKIVSQLTSQDLVDHCNFRLSEPSKPQPQTVYHDITYLLSVVKVAKQIFNINASTAYHDNAIETLVKLKLIGRSKKRERRISKVELNLMIGELEKRQNHRSAKIPYLDILNISLLTAMRVGEICNLLWTDIDHEYKTIIIRDRKDPKNKAGNDSEIPLLGDAYEIIMKQKDKIDREQPNKIFPYNKNSVSAGWQRVRNKLEIPDLRYHDLRREAASRLFEKGYPVEIVSKITGHKNINILLNVYTQFDMKKFSKAEYEKRS